MSTNPASLGARHDATPLHQSGFAASRSRSLQAMSLDYDLSITTADGRSARLSIDFASVDFRQVTTAAAFERGMASGDRARLATLGELGQQWQDRMVAAREEISIQASSLEVEFEGDLELLVDYFATEPTAQRIADFGAGLIAGARGGGMPALERAFAEVQRGIQEGYEQAKALMDRLAPQAEDTIGRALEMLQERYDDLLELLADSDRDEHAA